MKKKTILIIPPRGTRIRAIRIRLSVAVMLFILALVGVAGYFIPFKRLTLDSVDRNQKKNLKEQNKILLQKILSTLQLLNRLGKQVDIVESERERVSDLVGMIDEGTLSTEFSKDLYLDLSAKELVEVVSYLENRFISYVDDKDSGSTLFECVPVCKPLLDRPVISKRFGKGTDPFTGKIKWHYGTDFIGEENSPVIATAAGVVTKIETHPIWGQRVYINHGNGFQTIYAHLGNVTAVEGKDIDRGETVGTIGYSGLTTGPHVHYEVWHNGEVINPEEFFFPSVDSLFVPDIAIYGNNS